MLRRTLITAAAGAVALPAWVKRVEAAQGEVGAKEIVIGQSAVLSGPLGPVLKGFAAGAEMAFEAANARGGVYGRKIKYIYFDDELKPDRTVANLKTLISEHNAFAFFGAIGTGNIAAAIPVLQEVNAPMIGSYAASDSVRAKGVGTVYFVRAGYGREAEHHVQHLTSIGINRIALAHLANPGGEEVLTAVRAAIKAKDPGSDLVEAVAVKLDGTNAAEAGATLAKSKAQAVVMFAAGAPVVEMIKSVQDGGGRQIFYGMSTVAGDVVMKALGDRLRSGLAVSQVVPYPWSESDPVAREFRQRSTKTNLPVSYYTYEGYVNGLVLVEGLRRAGKTPTRANLHTAMQSFKAKVGGMDLDFTGGSTAGSKLVEMVHVRGDGRYVR
ncbi:MAG: transporter substrate-binding protein [Ramlibacter sp.]|nr:transporter substrate-binding protein [Ramlibacter sp.]